MSWRDNLVDASWKGAPFKVSSSTSSFGRRTQLHQYINRDKPFLQDLGGQAEKFSIEGYIIQDLANELDYFPQRDQLIRKLKSKGSGLLIHPFYGFKKVGLEGEASLTETFDNGGIVTFTATFTEAGQRIIPKIIEDFLNAIDNISNIVNDRVGDFFLKVYQTSGAFMGTAANAINTVSSTIQTAITGIQAIPTKIKSEANGNINNIRSQIDGGEDNAANVYNSIKDSANSFSVIAGLGQKIELEQNNTEGSPEDGDLIVDNRLTDIFANSISISSTVIGGETGGFSGISRGEITELDGTSIPDKIGKSMLKSIFDALKNFNIDSFQVVPGEQESNVLLIFNVMKLSLLINACRIGIRIDFFGQEDVIFFRKIILEVFEDFMLELGDMAARGASAVDIGIGTSQINTQDIFISVEQLRDTFARGMTEKISETVRAIDFIAPPDVSNTLSLAYDKYNDLDRMFEIFQQILMVFLLHPQ